MSTMVAMPVRVNPPPRGVGRHHFPDLSVLGNHNPRERRPDNAIVDGLLRHGNARFRGSHLLLGEGDFGPQTIGRGSGVVEGFLRPDSGVVQLLRAPQFKITAFRSCTSRSAMAAWAESRSAFVESRARL